MRDQVRRAFEAITESPHPALRSALRARLEAGPSEAPPRFWRLTVAATLVAGIAGLAFVAGISLLPRGGGTLPGPAASASATPSSEPTPTAAPTAAPSPSATAVVVSAACATSSGGTASSMADVTFVRVGTTATYDRFVIEFDGPVPAYSVTPQGSSAFMQDATGQILQLQGSSGVKIVVHGASGTDLNGKQTFTDSQDLKPNYPALKEARQVGDFERTFSWGLGLAQPACLHVTTLTGPDRLVVDVLKP
ncbi:MAG TPA: hypothetical protein VIP52_09155 [Candidatus Dormibacteraeota bacterium]